MSMHPINIAALADEHRRDVTARAETNRIARDARANRPAPSIRIFSNLVAVARRRITHLPLRKVPAAPRPS
jgi:hypothetical protein